MARPLRVELAGGWYHVTARGNERRPIYRADADRMHFLELLGQLPDRFGVMVHAFVLMGNHYHLLVETPRANLSQAMHWLNASYCVWFNTRHRRAGHLLQGRFKAVVVDREEWGLGLSRHVHLNPVRLARYGLEKRSGPGERAHGATVKERLERLRGYRWSSYRAYAGLEMAPQWLEVETVLGLVGKGARDKRARAYRGYVENAVREGLKESPWEELVAGVVLGGSQFVRRIRKHLQSDGKEVAGLRRLKGAVSWDQVVRVVEALKGAKWVEFRDAYGDWGRDLALYLGRRRCGMKLKELGAAAGGIDYVSVSVAVKRFTVKLARDRKMAERVSWAEDRLKLRRSDPNS